MNSMKEAFEDLVKDIHNAEKQITKALPKMMKKCDNDQLRQSFEQHLEETNDQIRKVEEVAKMCGFKPTGKMCPAMKGLIEEAEEHLKEGKPGPVLDAVMIASAQKVEHYEICSYGTARSWAKELGLNDCVPLLESILKQEEATDEKLNQLATSRVNHDAAGVQASESKNGKAKSSSGRATATSKASSNGKAGNGKASTAKSNGAKSKTTTKKSDSVRGKVSMR